MQRRFSPVVIQVHYSSDTESEDADLPKKTKKKRASAERRSGGSRSSAARLLRGFVTRNAHDSESCRRRPTVRRTRSYDNTAELGLDLPPTSTKPGITTVRSVTDMAAMSSAAAVSNSNSGSSRRSEESKSKQFLEVEEQRPRKSSGGSQTLHDMFSLRFGGKGSKEKKKKDSKKHADLPSPQGQGQPQSPTEQNITFSE